MVFSKIVGCCYLILKDVLKADIYFRFVDVRVAFYHGRNHFYPPSNTSIFEESYWALSERPKKLRLQKLQNNYSLTFSHSYFILGTHHNCERLFCLCLPVTRSHHSILYIVCNMVSNDLGPVRTGTNNLEERVSGSGLGDPPLTLKMRVICICFLLSVPDTKSSVSFEWTSNSPR